MFTSSKKTIVRIALGLSILGLAQNTQAQNTGEKILMHITQSACNTGYKWLGWFSQDPRGAVAGLALLTRVVPEAAAFINYKYNAFFYGKKTEAPSLFWTYLTGAAYAWYGYMQVEEALSEAAQAAFETIAKKLK